MKIPTKSISSKAVFSACNLYRYVLERTFEQGTGAVNFLMLNPSTADEYFNDPTIARCEKWAMEQGYKTLLITNVFAFRATNPQDMLVHDELTENNDVYILEAAQKSHKIICGWGNWGYKRQADILELLKGFNLQCFKINKNGTPSHPLYISMRALVALER